MAQAPDSDYEYRGLKAETWDLLYSEPCTGQDQAFYREVIQRHGQPALDVGCGTGRLLLDYLSSDIDIDGVDASPEMLAICREKAQQRRLCPRLFAQTMEALDLPRGYRTIIVPSGSFQLVVDPDAARLAMRRFWRQLYPGGVLVMPFLILPARGTDAETGEDWRCTAEKTRSDGTSVRLWSRATYDLAEQLEHTESCFEVLAGGRVIQSERYVRSPATRWYTPQQARALYETAGFTNIRVVEGFSDRPVAAGTRLFCVFGTRH